MFLVRYSAVLRIFLSECQAEISLQNVDWSRCSVYVLEIKHLNEIHLIGINLCRVEHIPVEKRNGKNRLIGEKSHYLLQHAENPVDWYPWGEEAFEKARKEDTRAPFPRIPWQTSSEPKNKSNNIRKT